MSSFGIDLGTTNSAIARLVDGRPQAIPVDGAPIVPSVVTWREGRAVVGREARNLELADPACTVRSVKRRMGTDHRYRIDGRELSPPEVSAEILAALRRGARTATGEEVNDVVITVPAYFDDAQRRATLDAAERAGLSVLRLLNEPTSAALIYDQVAGRSGGGDPEIVLVYDLGGGTFDASVLEVAGGVREVRATTGDTALGGDDFDARLVERFLDELRRRERVDPVDDPAAMARLRRIAEATKIRLSAAAEAHVREEFLTTAGGRAIHLDVTISRRDFEALVQPLLDRTIALAHRAIDDARLGGQRLERICLVGGSTRIPRVRALLTEAFDADVREDIDVDLAVALGAAVQAGLLQGDQVDRILVDVTAHSLGVRAYGPHEDRDDPPETFVPVLRRNTVLPAAQVEELYTMFDDQEEYQVEVYQGEAPRVAQNHLVGSFRFPLAPAPARTPVRVELAYDLNGVVRVSVSQVGAANEKTVALTVADAGARAQAGPPESALVRRATAQLEDLAPGPRAALMALLDRLRAAPAGPARATAEDAILDFLLDHEPAEEDEA